jgi:hypothetical protein
MIYAATETAGAVRGDHPTLMPPISLLELLLPDGAARQCTVIGSNCPVALRPQTQPASAQRSDLFLLAPTRSECRTAGWLVEQVALVAQQLAPDGVVYVLAPPYWRLKIASLLHDYGLSVVLPIAHVPDSTANGYLVPLHSGPVGYALTHLFSVALCRRWLAMVGLRLPCGEQLLGGVLPSVGYAVRRRGARPLFNWLLRRVHPVGQPTAVIISTSWRGPQGGVVVHCMSRQDARPLVVAKLTLTSTGDGVLREGAMLARLGPLARGAGAQIPSPLPFAQIGGRPVLLQSALSGQSAAWLLAAAPYRMHQLVERLASWLEHWNRATATVRSLDGTILQRELLTPAELLAPLIPEGEEYLEWLAECCTAAAELQAPLVATHNDLTMRNVLLEEAGELGIIDWEAARQEGLPLVDFFYAITDAAMATRECADRVEAFTACFAPGGAHRRIMARLLLRLTASLKISPEVVELCFHACWLHHAANEHRASRSDSGSFLAIVRRLARRDSLGIEGWADGRG